MRYICIITLLVLCLTLLLLTGCMTNTVTPEIDNGNLENQTVEEPSVEEPSVEEPSVEEPSVEEPAAAKVDTTKPVITGSRDPLPNSFGWNNNDVTVSFSCEDVGPVQSGIVTNTVAGATVTTEGKDQSVTNTGTCIDAAGNTADPVTISNINIDKTPPEVTITLPGTGEYVLNQSVTATWSATDALSGVVFPVSGSVSIDTSSVGTKTFTLPAGTAKDKAGNSSLKVTKSYSVIANADDPETENPQKWSGLGMGLYSWQINYVDILLDNAFTELRVDIPDYQDAQVLAWSKEGVTGIIATGANVIWGVSSNSSNNSDYTITAKNWPTFRQAILNAAQWAQDNGVYEFQIGNEEEWHVDGTTMTPAQIIKNLKAVAKDVQAIFSNGKVSYSCFPTYIDDWIIAGKGDIDILASNVYRGGNGYYGDEWKTWITKLVNGFGVDGTYLTEFNLSWDSLDDYSENETVQAAALSEMIEYIKASGMKRALYYYFYGDTCGAIKDDGSYRLLWSQALLNSESVKFATVPTKTTTALFPDTITFLPRVTR